MKQAIKSHIQDEYGISNENSNIYTLLIDGNSIMKMSISADHRIGGNGLEYGMVFQTLLQIKIMLNKKSWDYVYFMMDGENSGILRYEFYPEYKANRDKHYEDVSKTDYDRFLDNYKRKVIEYSRQKKNGFKTSVNKSETDNESFNHQRDIIFSILEELFIRQIICNSVEGDDLIAYYCKNKKDNEKIVIFSSDRDLTQLIKDDIAIYIPKLKKFITPKNDIQELGIPSYNIMLKKQICGDSSDNIYGIKGVGETNLCKLFPIIMEKKITINEIIEESKRINNERIKNKKKPLKSLSNIIDKVTDGSQGKDIYEINQRLIDLSEPLLTQEAKDEINNIMYNSLNPDNRNIKNVYKIIQDNEMTDLLSENNFSNFFSSFNPIMDVEKKRFEKNNL